MSVERVLDTPALRKARGAFFTPDAVAQFIARWAIRSADDRVLEPSCGDGAILLAAAERLWSLGGAHPVVGYELHPESAHDAEGALDEAGYPATIHVGDFLGSRASGVMTAAVGNPPYIRYQSFQGEARAAGLAAASAQGVQLSNLASSWAPFVVHTGGFLADHGRLALVLPAELLSSNYAQEVRDFLIRRFSRVQVVLFGGQVFPGVQTEALLLLAEGSGGTGSVEFAEVATPEELAGADFRTTLPVAAGDRWTAALVSPGATDRVASLHETGAFGPLDDWGRLALGAVTGNNRYFTLSPASVASLGLHASDVVPVSPAGSRHLRSLSLTEADHRRLGAEGVRTLLFHPDDPSPAALAYIRRGEADGVHLAYKCRVRTPWWRTPLPAPPTLFFTYMNAATPQLAVNAVGAYHLNSVHGLYIPPARVRWALELAIGSLNSVTALSAELTGRSYGGGILKMEPREAARLMVPSPTLLTKASGRLLDAEGEVRALLGAGQLDAARAVVDGIVLTSASRMTKAEIEQIRASHAVMRRRRAERAKARSGGGKPRGY